MKTQIAAVDFSTSKIVTVVAESQTGGSDRCEIKGSGTVPYAGFSDGDWNEPEFVLEAVRESISAAELDAKCKIHDVYVGVPGAFIHVRSAEAELTLPEVREITEDDLDEVQDMVADKLHIGQDGAYVLHRSPAWFSVDDGKKMVMPAGKRGSRLRGCISFIVADPEFIQDVREYMGALGIAINGFLAPVLGEGLLLLSNDERDRVATIIDVGYLNTEVSVYEGDAIIYHAILPEGGGYMVGDLMQHFRLNMDEAEQIKRAFLFNPDEFDEGDFYEVFDENGRRIAFPKANVARVVEHQMDQLCSALERTIRGDVTRFLGPRSQVYLTGGGISLMRGGREYLAEKIGMPVRAATVKTAKLNSPVYASALSLVSLVFDSIDTMDQDEGSLLKRILGRFQ